MDGFLVAFVIAVCDCYDVCCVSDRANKDKKGFRTREKNCRVLPMQGCDCSSHLCSTDCTVLALLVLPQYLVLVLGKINTLVYTWVLHSNSPRAVTTV